MPDRSAPRLRAILKAEIRFNDGASTVACLIRNLSEAGARIELAGEVTLPSRFDIHVAKTHQTRRATLKWREGREIGVSFEQPTVSGPLSDELTSDRLSKLAIEMAELRRLVDEMRAALAQPTASDETTPTSTYSARTA